MNFRETSVSGAWVLELERHVDERGFFARIWDPEELAAHGLTPRLAQCSIASTALRGTLRGLHFQLPPHEEAKLVRCTAGAIFDVVVDLRRSSPTFTRWFGVELTAANKLALYVPEGCAHGFLSLADECDVLYLISEPHVPAAARGVRWDDPAFAIRWPAHPVAMNDRDRGFADFAVADQTAALR